MYIVHIVQITAYTYNTHTKDQGARLVSDTTIFHQCLQNALAMRGLDHCFTAIHIKPYNSV